MRKELKNLEEAVPDLVRLGVTTALRGELRASPSKSYTHRAIMVGGLGQGCTIDGPLLCTDTTATDELWKKLGAETRYDAQLNVLAITGFDGSVCVQDEVLNVGEAGTLLRLALPGIAQSSRQVIIEGQGTIRSRPNSSVVEPLRGLGVEIQGTNPGDRVPITIDGKGAIECGEIRLDASSSSQAVSAFLLWAPTFCARGSGSISKIVLENDVVSRPYIEITIDALEWAGIEIGREGENCFVVPAGQSYKTEGKTFRVGGDYSSAAFVLAAACLVDSNVSLTGLLPDRQGDREIVQILERMGAQISVDGETVRIAGPTELKGVELDCGNTPDLVPVLTALACFADSPSRFFNVGHLKIKESDRLAAPAEELGKLGAQIELGESQIAVTPAALKPARVESHGDHRLAMALMVAGMRLPGLEVTGVKSILKSYPTFVSDMRRLGAVIE